MTLSELATFVCGKVNQTEVEDISACKGFLQQRFKLLWQHALWKDALVTYTQTLSPTGYAVTDSWLPTKGVLLVPPIIERVLAVRTDSRKLNVQRPEFYYRVDYDAFAKTGTPAEFLIMPPCVWELDASYSLYLHRLSNSDAAVRVTADTLDSDGISVTRNSIVLSGEYNSDGTTERIDAVLKAVTSGAVALQARGSIILTNNAPVERDFTLSTTADSSGEFGDIYSVAPGASVTLPAASNYIVALLSFSGPFYGTEPNAAGAFPDGSLFSGTVTYNPTGGFTFSSTTANNADVVSLAAADTAGKLRQRVRFVTIPDASLTVRILGKRGAPTFTNDLDQPGLTGVENALLAFAQADMLQRERHYAKAQALYQEAGLLLEQLKQEETVQMAHEQRIIPEGGYGDENYNRLYGFSF